MLCQPDPHTSDSARRRRTAQWHVSTTLPCPKTVPLYLACGSAAPRKPISKTCHYLPQAGLPQGTSEYSLFICLYCYCTPHSQFSIAAQAIRPAASISQLLTTHYSLLTSLFLSNNSQSVHPRPIDRQSPMQVRPGDPPVAPTLPITAPLSTTSPTFASISEKWQYSVYTPQPWSTTTVFPE